MTVIPSVCSAADVRRASFRVRRSAFCVLAVLVLPLFGGFPGAQSSAPDWSRLEGETMQHFQAILRLDTSNPPGNEGLVVDYLESVLKKEGIETKRFANDPARPNLVARLRGSGAKRPLLIMGHTDVVQVDPKKWTHPPFSATREGGYVYGRGTVDDKDNVVAGLMVMLQLKRLNVRLDRDVIFLAEAGEEAAPSSASSSWSRTTRPRSTPSTVSRRAAA